MTKIKLFIDPEILSDCVSVEDSTLQYYPYPKLQDIIKEPSSHLRYLKTILEASYAFDLIEENNPDSSYYEVYIKDCIKIKIRFFKQLYLEIDHSKYDLILTPDLASYITLEGLEKDYVISSLNSIDKTYISAQPLQPEKKKFLGLF